MNLGHRHEQKRVLIEKRPAIRPQDGPEELGALLQYLAQLLRRRLGEFRRLSIDHDDDLVDALRKRLIPFRSCSAARAVYRK